MIASTRPPAKICFVISTPMTAEAFLTRHIAALSERYDVHVIANVAPDAVQHPSLRKATWHRARVERAIRPVADMRGLFELVSHMIRERYDAVHTITPKAGLLGAMAAWIARVPVRVHIFTGQVWATRTGAARTLLKQLDRLIAALCTHVLVDSRSQRDFLRAQGVLRADQGAVLGPGSICGVDHERFRPDRAARGAVRSELGIPEGAVVFLFIGRLTRDKGVLDLARAWGRLAGCAPDAWLVLVGPDEDNLAPTLRSVSGSGAERLRLVGYTPAPERYMAAADVFCLPSYREGFGTVVLEAAAAGLPAIGSRIYGIVDAIADGTTGLLFQAGDVEELTAAMHRLASDAGLRATLGTTARARAVSDFPTAALTEGWLEFYAGALPPTSRTDGQAA